MAEFAVLQSPGITRPSNPEHVGVFASYFLASEGSPVTKVPEQVILPELCMVPSTSSDSWGSWGSFLPKNPFIRFHRHAPLRFPSDASDTKSLDGSPSCVDEVSESRFQQALAKLLKESPYVGFCRHAPPSPTLSFERPGKFANEDHFDIPGLQLGEDPTTSTKLPGALPEDVWTTILLRVLEVDDIPSFARIARGFQSLLLSPNSWQGSQVVVLPSHVQGLAPLLEQWLAAWAKAGKLVLPRSAQLQARVQILAPSLPIEVAWRFDRHAKGSGIEVIMDGEQVRRVGEDEVVVLGDAPLIVADGRAPYIEVQLKSTDDEFIGDGLNDFGIGVTARDPEKIEDLGSVAAEVPSTWVIDFTAHTVCLSINNYEEAKGHGASSGGLVVGDRVGVLFLPQECAAEVYINGQFRDKLQPSRRNNLLFSPRLFPVFDLYGRVSQLSRTYAERPTS